MAKQNHITQTSNKAQVQLKAAENATLTVPSTQHLEQSIKSSDGARRSFSCAEK